MSSTGTSDESSNLDLDKNALVRLNKSTKWLIENGFQIANERGTRKLSDILIDDFRVNLWNQVELSPDKYDSGFRVKSRGFNVDIIIIRNIYMNGILFEYWVAQKTSKDYAPLVRDSIFYITSAADINSKRHIIEERNLFLEKYTIAGKVIFSISPQDLATVYRLRPVDFPNNYRGTSIEGMEVRLDGSGKYTSSP